MISFYPGPSKLYPEVGRFMSEAVKEGILSMNHRSKEFMQLSEKTVRLLKRKLNLPADYQIFYTSSATECWEIIVQSLVAEESLHIYNGAFGEKWHDYTRRISPEASGIKFEVNTSPDLSGIKVPENGLIALVQNETSNGTQISNKQLKSIRAQFPQALIAVDATSSLAGIRLDISQADIWLASVQKCFGLPAGLGLLICSPRAMDKALKLNESNHYNSLGVLIERMKAWQTSYTPNVLAIYLLSRIMEEVPAISVTDKIIRQRANQWYEFFTEFSTMKALVDNPAVRSDTVIAVTGEEGLIDALKKKARKEGILLGNGYGTWAKTTFRIANFPALSEREIKVLQKFLKKNLK